MLTAFSLMTSISRLDQKQTACPKNPNISVKLFFPSSWKIQPSSCQACSLQPCTFNRTRRERAHGRKEALARHDVMCPPTTHNILAQTPRRSASKGHCWLLHNVREAGTCLESLHLRCEEQIILRVRMMSEQRFLTVVVQTESAG